MESAVIDPLFVMTITSLLLPLAVGLVTKLSASSGLKSLVLLVSNAVAALIVQATQADGSAVIEKQTFLLWAVGLAISVATYYGVYKPTGAADTVQNVAPTKGLG
jgi:hypothetical protein